MENSLPEITNFTEKISRNKRWLPKKTKKKMRNKTTEKEGEQNLDKCYYARTKELPTLFVFIWNGNHQEKFRIVKRQRVRLLSRNIQLNGEQPHHEWTTNQNFQMKIKWIETMNRHTLYGGVRRVYLWIRNNNIMLNKQLQQRNKKIFTKRYQWDFTMH